MAAMMQNTSSHTCILAPYASPGGATPSYRLVDPLRLRLAQIRFASGFHCRRDGILLADRNFLAALDQLIRAFPQFAGFLLSVVLHFDRLFLMKLSRLFARLRRKQNSYHRPNSQ